MISTANDPSLPSSSTPRDWAMTVFELAIFICAFRAMQPIDADILSDMLGGWFECFIAPEDAAAAAANMVSRGWLVMVGGRLMAAEEGRRVARTLVNGIIRMLDQGTRLLDVALMMAVLRLTKGELDDGRI
ncbi:MAG TPA: hypothetical protein VF503_15435 [Sphingobium sp.]|uniref:hypothetical protein n=1 Tax=Sphingobium sp. TaxID=1912891 RepID=UPI002ED2B0C7